MVNLPSKQCNQCPRTMNEILSHVRVQCNGAHSRTNARQKTDLLDECLLHALTCYPKSSQEYHISNLPIYPLLFHLLQPFHFLNGSKEARYNKPWLLQYKNDRNEYLRYEELLKQAHHSRKYIILSFYVVV